MAGLWCHVNWPRKMSFEMFMRRMNGLGDQQIVEANTRCSRLVTRHFVYDREH